MMHALSQLIPQVIINNPHSTNPNGTSTCPGEEVNLRSTNRWDLWGVKNRWLGHVKIANLFERSKVSQVCPKTGSNRAQNTANKLSELLDFLGFLMYV